MIKKINDKLVERLIKDDPVRPHINTKWRTSPGKEVYALFDENQNVRSVICVAYTDEVPINEDALKWRGMEVAVFYTVWSYDKGAGREIVNGVSKKIKKRNPYVKRFVTLSPLTKMAEDFHLRNGAKFIGKHTSCQNFEYFI